MTKFSAMISLAAAVVAVSCSPQTYNFGVQMRYPSDSGLDIGDKSVALVYLSDGALRDSIVNDYVADGLARGLEEDFRRSGYSTGVDIYGIVSDADYGCKDSLVSLVMRTEADVVILLGCPECTAQGSDKMQCRIGVWAYDSMSPVDSVWTVSASGLIASSMEGGSMLASDAQHFGYNLSKTLVNKWRDETYGLIYYDSLDLRWEDAADKAVAMRWDEAMSVWMEMLGEDRSDAVKSCLAYNMALGCYMTGEYALASEWLDISDSMRPVSLSASLRARVKARM